MQQMCIQIDLYPLNSKMQLHKKLQKAFGFPCWYGCNWDAFWDCLTDLQPPPKSIQFLSWSYFEKKMPKQAKILHDCMDEFLEMNVQTGVCIEYLA